MRIWRLITHHADKDHALFWTKQNSRIAIGWGAIGDIKDKGTNRRTILHPRSKRHTQVSTIRT
ncbi:MAG TPA: hypothetical protein VK557_18660 [Pyrinomonadaceae bacterium]|nr:hypothetical protein [Pyrinomonadaceae bacterium]